MLVAAVSRYGVRGQPDCADPAWRGYRTTSLHVPSDVVRLVSSFICHCGLILIRTWHSSDVSRNSEISLQCYLRTEEPKRGGDGIADDMGNDIYMGGVRFTPDFDDMGAPQEQWYELSGGSGKGKVMIALAYQPSTVSHALACCIGIRLCSPFRSGISASCVPRLTQPWELSAYYRTVFKTHHDTAFRVVH